MSWGEIKKAINSTLGTSEFSPLDKLIPYYIDKGSGDDIVEYTTPGVYTITVPIWASNARITACAGGGGGYANQTGTGGGGGGAAILNKLYTVPNAIKDTRISVSVGSGGDGCYYKDGSGSSYDVFGPYDGGNTTISALNITLSGGKKGTGTSGGAAGGTGGGAGGNPGTRNTAGGTGGAGVSGAGGKGASYYAGGGGGSLGAGGAGSYGSGSGTPPGGDGKLGGGGGACSTPNSPIYAHSGKGGDGYLKIEWLL